MRIFDRLYGSIELPEMIVGLLQSPELQHLHHVSLSAVPPWLTPTSTCASRLEHTLGVYHLCNFLPEEIKKDPRFLQICFATIAHDIGTPPFCHLSERFLQQEFKKSHEQLGVDILHNSLFGAKVERRGGDLDYISQLLLGQAPPWSELISGSLDLDNCDNTLRFGTSMGILPTDGSASYDPRLIVSRLMMPRTDSLAISSNAMSHLVRWNHCRRAAYAYVYSPAHQCAGAMLWRAIEFARREGQLSLPFFHLTDVEAFRYLGEQCNPQTKRLIERAVLWQFYRCVFTQATTQVSPGLQVYLENIETRITLADRLANEFHLPPEGVCAYAGKSRAPKRMPPVIAENHVVLQGAPPSVEQTWYLQVYLAPEYQKHEDAVREYMSRLWSEQSS